LSVVFERCLTSARISRHGIGGRFGFIGQLGFVSQDVDLVSGFWINGYYF
jgi:hypothetical protein